MIPGNAPRRSSLPWLPYPKSDKVLINSHNFGGGIPARDMVKRSNIFTDYTSGIQTVAASSELGTNNRAWKAVDGNNTTTSSHGWICANSGLPAWWSIDFGAGQPVYSAAFSTRSNSAVDRPYDFVFESSNDNSNWIARHTVTSHTWAANQNLIEFVFDDPAIARYWRIRITASSVDGSGTRTAIVEIEWYS